MHLLTAQVGQIDEGLEPVDLGQDPADLVVLTAADTEIAGLARAHGELGADAPSLRLASLLNLGHNFSVDLYIEKTLAASRFIVLRLIGGHSYWRYGTDEVVALARREAIPLVVLSGTGERDRELERLSTAPAETVDLFWAYLSEGGPDNYRNAILHAGDVLWGTEHAARPAGLERAGFYEAGGEGEGRSGRAAIVFYRALMQAGDLAPVDALAGALRARGLAVRAIFVASLKDPAASRFAEEGLGRFEPDVVVNATAFAAGRIGDEWDGTALDRCGAPVLQAVFSGTAEAGWRESLRGLSPRDLAMHVALPEVDGRIVTRAVSFKAERAFEGRVQAPIVGHEPLADRIGHVADLAAAYARLRRTARGERRIGLVLSNYPASDGRLANGVGLDTPASVAAILTALAGAGYGVADAPADGEELMRRLMEGPTVGGHEGRKVREVLPAEAYRAAFAALPERAREAVTARWGAPEEDAFFSAGHDGFAVPALAFGNVTVLLQPGRGRGLDARAAHHDLDLAPPHGYIAAYLWLEARAPHAIAHIGKHGSLEWMPGKALALSAECWPELLLGPVPHVYPFIANDPGEGAQAKRRAHAVIVDHLIPPLARVETYGPLRDLEALCDEYYEAASMDPRRRAVLAEDILSLARASGVDRDCGIAPEDGDADALAKLDAFLCDLKDLVVRDGLHVFGVAPPREARDGLVARLAEAAPGADADAVAARVDACAGAEMGGFLKALDGHFLPPGPSGAPTRGRLDVLPTGRNFFSVDTRAVPTEAAWRISSALAGEMVLAFAQEHGRWPERIALTAWGTANMRTGGDDVAQVLALIGARPRWDAVSKRVTGFEIVPVSELKRPRVDVVLRISGFFRDAFPGQLDLINSAIRAVAALDEPQADNPLAARARREAADMRRAGLAAEAAEKLATRRVFGSAAGRYGAGLKDLIEAGAWDERADLAEAYLAASGFAYDGAAEGEAAREALTGLLAETDAVAQTQDAREFDLLDSTDFYEFQGGLAAAVEHASGAAPSVYHADTSRPDHPVVRRLSEEIALVVRGRAASPRWCAAMRRHGYRGGAEMAATVTSLFAYAATTGLVTDAHFDAVYDAYLGDAQSRTFLEEKNPAALAEIEARLAEAVRRGLWRPQRNSTAAEMTTSQEETPCPTP